MNIFVPNLYSLSGFYQEAFAPSLSALQRKVLSVGLAMIALLSTSYILYQIFCAQTQTAVACSIISDEELFDKLQCVERVETKKIRPKGNRSNEALLDLFTQLKTVQAHEPCAISNYWLTPVQSEYNLESLFQRAPLTKSLEIMGNDPLFFLHVFNQLETLVKFKNLENLTLNGLKTAIKSSDLNSNVVEIDTLLDNLLSMEELRNVYFHNTNFTPPIRTYINNYIKSHSEARKNNLTAHFGMSRPKS